MKTACSPDEMARGAAQAHRFLQQFSNLPLDQMNMKEAAQLLNKLRNELENDAAHDHPWLQQFF